MDARLGRVVCASRLADISDKRAITAKSERIRIDLFMMAEIVSGRDSV